MKRIICTIILLISVVQHAESARVYFKGRQPEPESLPEWIKIMQKPSDADWLIETTVEEGLPERTAFAMDPLEHLSTWFFGFFIGAPVWYWFPKGAQKNVYHLQLVNLNTGKVHKSLKKTFKWFRFHSFWRVMEPEYRDYKESDYLSEISSLRERFQKNIIAAFIKYLEEEDKILPKLTILPPLQKSIVTTAATADLEYISADNLELGKVEVWQSGRKIYEKDLYLSYQSEASESIPLYLAFGENRISVVAKDWVGREARFETSILRKKAEDGVENIKLSGTELSKLLSPKLDFSVDLDHDGKYQSGDTAKVKVSVSNLGEGLAKLVRVRLKGDENFISLTGSMKEVGDIKPNETKVAIFQSVLPVDFSLKNKEAQISVVVREARGYSPVKEIEKQIVMLSQTPVDVDKNIPVSAISKPDALAVIFGIETYKKVSGVTFAKQDATIFKDYAVKVLGVPDNKNNIYFLTDEVTLGEFKKAFGANGWLARRVKPTSDVYIFYAGHGAPDIENKRGFLIPQDGDPNYAGETGYSIDELYKFLNNLKAKSVSVFLDSCFSGANRENKMLLAQARPLVTRVQVQIPQQNNLTIFSAASGNQISSGYPEKQHGLFSYFLMKGLKGDADKNKDGALNAGELQSYLLKNVQETAVSLDREQTPEMFGDASRVLVRYK